MSDEKILEQEAPADDTESRMRVMTIIKALQNQRDDALNKVADLEAEMAVLRARLDRLSPGKGK